MSSSTVCHDVADLPHCRALTGGLGTYGLAKGICTATTIKLCLVSRCCCFALESQTSGRTGKRNRDVRCTAIHRSYYILPSCQDVAGLAHYCRAGKKVGKTKDMWKHCLHNRAPLVQVLAFEKICCGWDSNFRNSTACRVPLICNPPHPFPFYFT